MLDGFDLLKSVSAADEHDIDDCAQFFNLTAQESCHRVRKFSRTLLIAAVIAALLAVTASAIGISVYLRHQQELNGYYKIEENQVVNYAEYPIHEQSGLTIISCLADGEFYHVYAAVSPISEEEAMSFFRFNFEASSLPSENELMYIEVATDNNASVNVYPYSNQLEYAPEDMGDPERTADGGIMYNDDGTPYRLPTAEARIRKHFENSYDPETQTLMLELWIREEPVVSGNPIELRASLHRASYIDDGGTFKSDFIRDLGNTLLIPPEYKPLTLYFPEPIVLVNEEDDVHLIYEGLEISNSTIYILMRSPEAEYVYKYDPYMSAEEKQEQAEYRERWQYLRWENDTNVKLTFTDGQVITLNGCEASLYVDGVIRGICLISEPSINFNNIESIYIAGQTIPRSACLDSPEAQ